MTRLIQDHEVFAEQQQEDIQQEVWLLGWCGGQGEERGLIGEGGNEEMQMLC